jgi:outer membrane protein assembly factor BamD (BamD/ComL family)
MYQRIIKATILLLLILPASLPAAMDFIFEESLSKSLERMEKLYTQNQWDEAMNIGRGIIKDAPKDHPTAARARDLIILSLDGKNKQLIAEQNREKIAKNKERAQQLMAEGSKLLTDKNYKTAAQQFSRALKLHPGDSQ